MFVSCWQFGRYPVSIYRQPLRALLTYVLPVAMLSTVPSLALTRGIGGAPIGAAGSVALTAVAVTNLTWRAGCDATLARPLIDPTKAAIRKRRRPPAWP